MKLKNWDKTEVHRAFPQFLLYTVTDRNIAFSGTPSTCYLLSFRNLIVNPVHFLLTENIKRGNQGIII
jgi:hypothetical protein